MLYYQLAIAPAATHPQYSTLGYGIASLMVSTSDGVAAATARALEHLARQHWQVVKVREARLSDSPDDYADDERLARLYERADRAGIALLLAVPGYLAGSAVEAGRGVAA